MKENVVGREQRLFVELPVYKAVASMAIPTVVSQLITVFYNLADTWYVGLTDSAVAVAAVSLCLPIYRMLTALGNLFGIGGASVIARALGKGDIKRAKQTFSSVSRWALISTAIYSVVLFTVARPLLMLIGATEDNIGVSLWYAYITIVLGGVPTVLSIMLSHLIRSTGRSKKASFGITLGAVLNIALDPLFMFVILPKGYEVIGAAIATALSNLVALTYYIIYILRNKDISVFCFSEKKCDRLVLPDVIKSGFPSFTMVSLSMLSNCFLNGLIGNMGSNAAVAGLGIVRKIDAVAFAVNQGITQGMLPIVAYCFAQKNYKRMKKVVVFSSFCTVSFSIICSIISYIFAPELISVFIRDALTIEFGTEFLRVLCIAVAIYPMVFIFVSVFQAVGQSKKPFIISIINKGSFDILLFFIIKEVFGVEYILWSAPITSTAAVVLGSALIYKLFSSFKKQK